MKIYTKTGDKGETSFYGGERVLKDDPRIEALGALDELNSVIGITLCFTEDQKLRTVLLKIQNDLFTVGADIAAHSTSTTPKIQESHITEMEQWIDELETKLGLPQKFILPHGTISSSFLHLCRTITRRAERTIVHAHNTKAMNENVLRYVNRLSDLLYVLAREANKEIEFKEQQPIYKYFNDKPS